MNCTVCGSEMRQIPAGVSRATGMAYNAFMACPQKCKQGNSYGTPVQRPFVQATPVAPARDYVKEARGKIRHGLVCAFIQGKTIEAVIKDFPEFKKHLLSFEGIIMNGVRENNEKDFIKDLEEAQFLNLEEV